VAIISTTKSLDIAEQTREKTQPLQPHVSSSSLSDSIQDFSSPSAVVSTGSARISSRSPSPSDRSNPMPAHRSSSPMLKPNGLLSIASSKPVLSQSHAPADVSMLDPPPPSDSDDGLPDTQSILERDAARRQKARAKGLAELKKEALLHPVSVPDNDGDDSELEVVGENARATIEEVQSERRGRTAPTATRKQQLELAIGPSAAARDLSSSSKHVMRTREELRLAAQPQFGVDSRAGHKKGSRVSLTKEELDERNLRMEEEKRTKAQKAL